MQDTVILHCVLHLVNARYRKDETPHCRSSNGASNQQRKRGAVMVAVNHIPHLVHTQTAFVWRFLA
ncbi:host cell division inhibitor Icd-like protein, partial [Escherichia coli]